jgi:O-antigen ligase
MQTLSKFFPTQTVNRIIVALVAWQFISVALMAVGTWPANLAILNTVLIGLFIVFFKPYYSVLLLILSIPFYIILPLPVLQNMPMWRVLFALLFVVWFIHLLINQRKWLLKLFSFQRSTAPTPVTGARMWEVIVKAYQRIDSRLMPWDKVAVIFLFISLFSLIVAKFQVQGFKQILFLLNVYIFYIVIVNVVTDAEKVKEIIRYTLYSLGIMVALGYVQYFATLFSLPYYFWQYWAIMISSLYYGTPLANVLAYSNSWFSYSGGSQSLRMFGILPDTHAFGVICIFFLAYLIPYLKLTGTTLKTYVRSVKDNHWYIVIAVILGTFGIMANGTRGIWLAMLIPLGIALSIFWFTEFLKPFFKVTIAVYCLVLLMFILSPFISRGMNLIRTVDVNDDFLGRAGSVYDLNESSNVGRLEIWQSSLRFAAVHPFGVGYGNFITSIIPDIPDNVSYEEISGMKNLRYNLPQEFITAHSLYLQLLVELGFAGLLAFALFWIEYFQKLWLFLRARAFRLNRYSVLLLSIAMGMVWLLAYGIFDLTILNDRVLQYLFISLAISGLVFAKYDSLEPTPEESAEIVV